jgi:S-adenosylmethionine:tRNA ribosyltransferase-isomerase
MDVSEFDFELPEELIAQEAVPRGRSRLLVLDRSSGQLSHTTVADLPAWLKQGDLLVANDTRVFPARLLGSRVPSGGAVECLLLAPIQDPRSPTPDLRSPREWTALMHPGQKLKPGALVRFEHSAGVLMAEVLERQYFGRRRIRLWAESGGDVDALVDAMGHVPLPPYIHRDDTPEDRERYQTVFAAHRGSIAAPTAGLHFDEALLAALDRAGVERVTITLHVGYGTFKPVRAERVEDHEVDPEPYEISASAADAINAALEAGRRVIAIGTTTTRALEDAARRGGLRAGAAVADTFIYPGFEFRVISGLITNFHLPKSSLLMMVSAFAGRPSTGSGRVGLVEGRERVLAAYREAVAHRYRFYSYGDAMLVI